jgi:hypothetical protein
MSGGSFEYLFDRFEDGDPLDDHSLELLASMVNWLNDPEQSQPEAAKELRKTLKELIQIKLRINRLIMGHGSRFYKLVRATEWWASNDIDESEFIRAWLEYKNS